MECCSDPASSGPAASSDHSLLDEIGISLKPFTKIPTTSAQAASVQLIESHGRNHDFPAGAMVEKRIDEDFAGGDHIDAVQRFAERAD